MREAMETILLFCGTVAAASGAAIALNLALRVWS